MYNEERDKTFSTFGMKSQLNVNFVEMKIFHTLSVISLGKYDKEGHNYAQLL